MNNPFNSPAFSMAALTSAINIIPNRYGRMEALNLFPVKPVRTRQVIVEEQNGVLNLLPYIGSIVVAGASALVAFVQFGEIDMAIAVSGASLFIHMITGNLLVPWLTSKTSRMNPVTVFVGVLAWGWLWGVWGLLLGIPILMIVKTVCDRVDHLKPVGELLGT